VKSTLLPLTDHKKKAFFRTIKLLDKKTECKHQNLHITSYKNPNQTLLYRQIQDNNNSNIKKTKLNYFYRKTE